MLLDQLNNFSGLSKDRDIFVDLEVKLHLVPSLNDVLNLVLNLIFLLGSFNQFLNIDFIVLEFEGDQVGEAELGALEADRLASELHKFFPMSLLHELRVQLRDEWEDLRHVLDSVVKRLERLEALDLLVVVRVGLLGSHLSALGDQTVSVDLVPEDLLPGSELRVDKGNQIPVLLKVNEIVFAVIEHLELRLSQSEESLQVAEALRLSDHVHSLLVVLFDLVVRGLDDFRRSLSGMVRARFSEFLSVIVDLKSESTDLTLDVLGFLGHDREDLTLDRSKGLLSDINKLGLGVFENDKEIVLGLHGDSVLLEE